MFHVHFQYHSRQPKHEFWTAPCLIFLVLIDYNRCTELAGKYLVAENSNFLWILKMLSLLHSLQAKMSFLIFFLFLITEVNMLISFQSLVLKLSCKNSYLP